MKVILGTASSDMVGVATHVFNLAKLLHAEGSLDLVACPRAGWLSDQLADCGLPYTVLQISPDPRTFIKSNVAFARLLQERKTADIVHLHGRFPLFVSSLSLRACRDRTFVATVHQFKQQIADGPLGWKARLETLLLKRMQRICCVSQDLKDEVMARIGPKNGGRVDVIANWIEPLWARKSGAMLRERSVPTDKEVRICAVGYLHPVKGFDVLLEAVHILRQRGWRARCDIFGSGPEKRNLLALAAKLGLSEFVTFKDPAADLRCLLPEYNVVVVPSRSESFSLVVLEAYDAAVPVVASNVSGLRTTVVDGETGLLFEQNNAASLAEKLIDLFSREGLAARLAGKARKHLENYVPNEKLRKCYSDFYAMAQADRNNSSRDRRQDVRNSLL